MNPIDYHNLVSAYGPRNSSASSNQFLAVGLLTKDKHGELCGTPLVKEWHFLFDFKPNNRAYPFYSTLISNLPIQVAAWQSMQTAFTAFDTELAELESALTEHLGVSTFPPRLITELRTTIASLRDPSKLEFLERSTPALARTAFVLAIKTRLLALHRQRDQLELRARDRELLDDTLAQIGHLDEILARDVFAPERASARKPRLSDYVNIGVLEAQRSKTPPKPRVADEKFGILSAPGHFDDDYAELADAAFSRDRSFALAFLDIDDFKTFNTEHGETVVDQDVLPYFMRAIEAHCYGRAIAYRQGGDEYLVLLRNATPDEARTFFDTLRTQIARIPYPDTVKRRPTLSIGVHVIDAAHELTVFEAKQRANAAKGVAKKAGKDCVRLSGDPEAE